MRISNYGNRPIVPDKLAQKPADRRERTEQSDRTQAGEGFLPVKSHPIGDEIRHYYVDNSGEMPERVHFEVNDAREPLPFERVKLLLAEIEQSLLNGDEALKAQRAAPPETVLRLLE
ncbi:MAG: hypothetical protein GX028_01035 [Clostridiaceae bacterium]|nr:hypothetical protein [Clostridiaceae bacterium]